MNMSNALLSRVPWKYVTAGIYILALLIAELTGAEPSLTVAMCTFAAILGFTKAQKRACADLQLPLSLAAVTMALVFLAATITSI